MLFSKISVALLLTAIVSARPIAQLSSPLPLTNSSSPDTGGDTDSASLSNGTDVSSLASGISILATPSADLTFSVSATGSLSPSPTNSSTPSSTTDDSASASVTDTGVSATPTSDPDADSSDSPDGGDDDGDDGDDDTDDTDDSSDPTDGGDNSTGDSPASSDDGDDNTSDSSDTDPTATDNGDSSSNSTSTSVAPVITALPVPPAACVALAASLPTASGDTIVSDSFSATSFDPTVASATVSSTIDSALPPIATGFSNLTSSSNVTSSNATLTRRIAQADLPAVAQSWQDLCLVSGGDIFTNEPCVNLAGIDGINALLASGGPCDQQDNADAMIDFAKSPGVTNTDALIANAVAYRQHPRNALEILGTTPSTPYCSTPPRNPELAGVVNAQLSGVNPGIFGNIQFGLFAFGANGSCPLGQTPDVTTCSCS
ncbi:hypothetical protein OBBRIDRAFT_317139 [Obba rivulosa]|uniref:Uncharacterized protein n=1 Tax=Obba rivulosa TaxID=1052685 RepID=A0A8E2DPJ2_9APHY|nr:hypothetical protein OBBRIDRAFT_317139 [Obba rivulosa]